MEENEPSEQPKHLTNKNAQVVSASTAGIRALLFQISTLYLRTPAKLFRPSRFDYMASVRILLHGDLHGKPYNFWSHSTLGMVINAVRKHGWRFIPDQILPPLIANSLTGVVLYTSYLTSLQHFNNGKAYMYIYNNKGAPSLSNDPSPLDTFRAGFVAGAAQSLVAAPLDAIYARSNAAEILEGKHKTMWEYGIYKLKQVGLVGVFAGFSASFIKESVGFGVYFATFEIIKNQGYHSVRIISEKLDYCKSYLLKREYHADAENSPSARILQTFFILLAGASAAFSLLAIQYPVSKVQKMHLARLEALDIYNSKFSHSRPFINVYYRSYADTVNQVVHVREKSQLSWFQWSYKGFVRNALTTIPATSVGLLVFEILRQRLSTEMLGEAAPF